MPSARFEPVIPASDRPQTHALDRAATGIGGLFISDWKCRSWNVRLVFSRVILNAVDWKGRKTWDSSGRSWPNLIHFWLYSQVAETLKRDFPCFSYSLIRPFSRKISSFLQRLKANQKIVKVLHCATINKNRKVWDLFLKHWQILYGGLVIQLAGFHVRAVYIFSVDKRNSNVRDLLRK
jgi:hypothetical protein